MVRVKLWAGRLNDCDVRVLQHGRVFRCALFVQAAACTHALRVPEAECSHFGMLSALRKSCIRSNVRVSGDNAV